MSLTGVAFVVSYLYGLLRTFMNQPFWGLYIYIAVFYLHPPLRWWGRDLPDLRWSLTAAVVTLLTLLSSARRPDPAKWTDYPVVKIIIAYVVWMWIQFPWANPEHFDGLVLLSKYVVLIYIIYRLVDSEQTLKQFALAHVIGCFYFGLLTLDASGEGRLELIGGPGVNDSNTLGMHVTTGIFFAGSLILATRGWQRWAVIAMVPVLANCVVQTESRGAFLGAVIGGAVYFLTAPRRHRSLIVGLGTLCVFVLLAYTPMAYWERMSSINRGVENVEERDKSAESRLVIIKAQWEMFKDHPLGLGFNSTAYLSRRYLGTEWLTAARNEDIENQGARASHNTLMSTLVDQGLPGIILALAAVVAILRGAGELNRNRLATDNNSIGLFRAAICSSLASIFVSGMFTNYLKAEVQLWMIALLVACLHVARLKNKAPAITQPSPDMAATARHREQHHKR
jgi:O-antigen ligase